MKKILIAAGAILLLLFTFWSVTAAAGTAQTSDTHEIILTPQIPADTQNGIIRGDVPVDLEVNCPDAAISQITYEIVSEGIQTGRSEIYHYYADAPETMPKICHWSNSSAILVDSLRNDSDDVQVSVHVTDLAGHEFSESVSLCIDSSGPEIRISYEDAGAVSESGGTAYASGVRQATIYVNERNFDPSLVQVQADGAALSGWQRFPGTCIYYRTVTWTEDGTYQLAVSGSDLAGNTSEAADTGSSEAPFSFVLDGTAPEISLEFEDGDASDGAFFAAGRTALLTVCEENLKEIKVSDCGAEIPFTEISSDGETHKYRIRVDGEGEHKLTAVCLDKAGNEKKAESPVFTIDTTAPEISFTDVYDGLCHTAESVLKFQVSLTEQNPSEQNVTFIGEILRNGKIMQEDMQETHPEFLSGEDAALLSVEDLAEDGVYTLKVSAKDKAGNYTEKKVIFTVNRGGAVYQAELPSSYYIQDMSGGLAITLFDPEALSNLIVSLNDTVLEEGIDYTKEETGEEGHIRKYQLNIAGNLLENEGEYRLLVHAEDNSGHISDNEQSGCPILFAVDRTPPVVTVSGLVKSGRYREDIHEVHINAEDYGGKIQSLQVFSEDKNTGDWDEILNLTGDEAEGISVFSLKEGFHQNLKIICTDEAGGADGQGNRYEEIFSDVSVSTSGLRLFIAGRPAKILFVLLVLSAGVLIRLRVIRSRRENAKERLMDL